MTECYNYADACRAQTEVVGFLLLFHAKAPPPLDATLLCLVMVYDLALTYY